MFIWRIPHIRRINNGSRICTHSFFKVFLPGSVSPAYWISLLTIQECVPCSKCQQKIMKLSKCLNVFKWHFLVSLCCLQGLLDDWTSKAPAVQDINSKGSALCSLISVLTSPAKAKIRRNSGIAQEYFKISHVSILHDCSLIPPSVKANRWNVSHSLSLFRISCQ